MFESTVIVKTKFYVPNLILFFASSPRSLRFVSAFDRAAEYLQVVDFVFASQPASM